jgi:predicted kinase
VDVVVCDCINITKDEYQKYVDVAKDNDYIVSFVVLDRPDSFLAAGRNKHDVSKEQIDEMYARWEN